MLHGCNKNTEVFKCLTNITMNITMITFKNTRTSKFLTIFLIKSISTLYITTCRCLIIFGKNDIKISMSTNTLGISLIENIINNIICITLSIRKTSLNNIAFLKNLISNSAIILVKLKHCFITFLFQKSKINKMN